jgi:hypothetical protein
MPVVNGGKPLSAKLVNEGANPMLIGQDGQSVFTSTINLVR